MRPCPVSNGNLRVNPNIFQVFRKFLVDKIAKYINVAWISPGMRVTFQSLGWKSKVAQKRATLSISINKLVAVGCGLEKGKSLYCYVANDEKRRPVLIAYLDGKQKP